MKQIAHKKERAIAGDAVAKADVISILEVEQHFLNRHEIQDGAEKSEQADGGDGRDDTQQGDEDENCFKETGIGLQLSIDLIATLGFAEPAGPEACLKFLQISGIGKQRWNFRLLEPFFFVAVRYKNLADFALQFVKFLNSLGAQELRYAFFFLFVVGIVIAGADQSGAGDFLPRDGLGLAAAERVVLEMDARFVELDVNGDRTSVDVEARAHGGAFYSKSDGGQNGEEARSGRRREHAGIAPGAGLRSGRPANELMGVVRGKLREACWFAMNSVVDG